MKTYKEFIQNILDTRGRFACGEEYHERHHIIPKCMDGGNEKENLIDLFAREHFEAHRLLALENPDNEKLIYAWTMMSWIKTKNQERYQLTSEEYEEAKIAFSKMNSKRKGMLFGENNPNYGNHKLAGINNPRARQVVQLSKNGEFIKQWSYISEAAIFLNCLMDNIVSCCSYRIPSAYGFLWMYLEEYEKYKYLSCNELVKLWKSKTDNGEKHSNKPRKVIRLFDGAVYDTVTLSAKENNICNATMTGKCKRHDGFMYYDEWTELQNKKNK